MAVASDSFACPGCGKQYKWKPDVAGKKVRCAKCNLKVRVPAAGGAKAEALEPIPGGGAPAPKAAAKPAAPAKPARPAADDDYELNLDDELAGLAPKGPVQPISLDAGGAAPGGATAGKCPSCNAKVKPGAVICLNCGFNLQSGKKVKTAIHAGDDAPKGGAPAAAGAGAAPGGALALSPAMMKMVGKRLDTSAVAEDLEKEHRFKEKVLPLILLAVGVGMALLNTFIIGPAALNASGYTDFNGNPLSVAEAGMMCGLTEVIRTVLQVPMLFIAVLVVASLFGTSFGPILIAVIKLLALALVAGAADQMVGYGLDIATGGLGAMVGGMFQWSISVAIFFTLCTILLETDMMETLVLWLITTLAPTFILLFAGAVILGMFM